LQILLHTPRRLAVSLAGILLAVVLMFSQSGFRNAMFDSQAELIHRLNGELLITSKVKHIIYAGEPFARRRLSQARACPGVKAVYPLYIEANQAAWKNPHDGSIRPLRVLAFDPGADVLDVPELHAHADALRMPDAVLFDSGSRDYYGRPQAGTVTELSGKHVEVAGTFHMGTDFFTDGNVIMSDRNFLKFFPDRGASAPHLDRVEIGIIQLKPGANPRTVQQALRQALPDDVEVLTKQELVEKETRYWRDNTSIGYIFSLGMFVGFVIGILICYQILYTNVASYLPQFATLKAMGYTDAYLVGVVVQQGVFLAILGFLPAVLVAQVLFWVVSGLTGLLMFFTPLRLVFILLLTVAMCMVSGAIAVRRVVRADPAEVFR
jgi:putative ABC transport system permease protein